MRARNQKMPKNLRKKNRKSMNAVDAFLFSCDGVSRASVQKWLRLPQIQRTGIGNIVHSMQDSQALKTKEVERLSRITGIHSQNILKMAKAEFRFDW